MSEHGRPARPTTPAEIEALNLAVMYDRAVDAAHALLDLHKQALRGAPPDRQVELTRAMRRIRDQMAAIPTDDLHGIDLVYRTFTTRVLPRSVLDGRPAGPQATSAAIRTEVVDVEHG